MELIIYKLVYEQMNTLQCAIFLMKMILIKKMKIADIFFYGHFLNFTHK